MTDWDALARPSLRGLERYDPGLSRDALRERHGLDELEPLNWNEDRFGPPEEVLEAARAEVGNVALYPERASALVLRGTGPRFATSPEWPWGWSEEEAAPQLDIAEQQWGTGTVLPYFIQGVADDERAQEETGRF